MSDSVTVLFPVSKTELLTAYMGNEERLDTFVVRMDSILHLKSGPFVRSIEIFGAASPEGSYGFNRSLSGQRAKAVLDYLDRKLNVPDSLVSISYAVRNWNALRSAIDSDSLVPDRKSVLNLLDSYLQDAQSGLSAEQSDRLLLAIRSLDGGKPYRFMLKNIFPSLREAKLVITFYMPPQMVKPRSRISVTDFEFQDSISEIIPEMVSMAPPKVADSGSGMKWALRTNLLFDALGAPGLGAELYLGHGFSVQGEWMYAWWSHRNRNFFWRLYGGDVGFRWWFGKLSGRQPLSGHHVGIYAQALIWDFELGGRGYMGGVPGDAIWQRANLAAGLEYGYSLPVARRWNIDFSIGIGYMGGSYREYVPMCGYYVWQSTKRLNYVGPTKAEISLVYRF